MDFGNLEIVVNLLFQGGLEWTRILLMRTIGLMGGVALLACVGCMRVKAHLADGAEFDAYLGSSSRIVYGCHEVAPTPTGVIGSLTPTPVAAVTCTSTCFRAETGAASPSFWGVVQAALSAVAAYFGVSNL